MQKPALCRALAQNLAVLQDRFGRLGRFLYQKALGGRHPLRHHYVYRNFLAGKTLPVSP